MIPAGLGHVFCFVEDAICIPDTDCRKPARDEREQERVFSNEINRLPNNPHKGSYDSWNVSNYTGKSFISHSSTPF
jgi:hypothetical protein